MISPSSLGLKPGEGYQLSVYVSPEDAKDKTIIWTSSDETCATVNSAGYVQAVSTDPEGCTATITASAGDGSGISSSITVVVSPALPELEQIQLNQDTYTVKVGKTVLVQATPIPATADIGTLEYEIVDTNIATVSEYGVITGVKKGTTKIIVRSLENTAVYSEATVKVTSGGGSTPVPPPTPVDVTSVEIPFPDPKKPYFCVNVDSELQMNAIVSPSNASDKTLTWKVGDTKLASISKKGLVKGIKVGKTTVTATSSNGKKATVDLYVEKKGTSAKASKCYSGGGGDDPYTPTKPEKPEDPDIKGGESTTSEKYNLNFSQTPTSKETQYNLTVIGKLKYDSASSSGWLNEKSNPVCHITVSGYYPSAKYEYRVGDGSPVEFQNSADVHGTNVTVTITPYYGSSAEATPKADINQKYVITKTVCQANYDDVAPRCGLKLTEDGTSIEVDGKNTNDEGSGLSSIALSTGKSIKCDEKGCSGSVNIMDAFNAWKESTEEYKGQYFTVVGVAHDKAGNSSSCFINIDDKGGTNNDESNIHYEFRLYSYNVTLDESHTSERAFRLRAEEFRTAMSIINDFITCEDGDWKNYIEIVGSGVARIKKEAVIVETKTFNVTCTLKDYHDNPYDAGMVHFIGSTKTATITVKSNKHGITCEPTYNESGSTLSLEKGSAKWRKGDLKATCSTDNSAVKIDGVTVYFNGKEGTTATVAGIGGYVSTLKTPTGQGEAKVVVTYTMGGKKETYSQSFGKLSFDNTVPTCKAVLDEAAIRYEFSDGDGETSSRFKEYIGDPVANISLDSYSNYQTTQISYELLKNKVNQVAGSGTISDNLDNKNTCSSKVTLTKEILDEMEKSYNKLKNQCRLLLINDYVRGEAYADDADVEDIQKVAATSDAKIEFEGNCGSGVPTTSVAKIFASSKSLEASTHDRTIAVVTGITESGAGATIHNKCKRAGKTTATVCAKDNVASCVTYTIECTPAMFPPRSLGGISDKTIQVGSKVYIDAVVYPTSAEREVTMFSNTPSVVSVEGKYIVGKAAGSATITVQSVANPSLTKTFNVTVNAATTAQKPTVSISTQTANSSVKSIYVMFAASDKDGYIDTLKYNVVKGSSCEATNESSTKGKNSVSDRMLITTNGTYTACVEAIDDTGNSTKTSRAINVTNLYNQGEVNCSANKVLYNLEQGKTYNVTYSCTSAEALTLDQSKLTGTTGDVSFRTTTTQTSEGMNTLRVYVTVNAIKEGTGRFTIGANAIHTVNSTGGNGTYTNEYTVVKDAGDTDVSTTKAKITGPSQIPAEKGYRYTARLEVGNSNNSASQYLWSTNGGCVQLSSTSGSTITVTGRKAPSGMCQDTLEVHIYDKSGNIYTDSMRIVVLPDANPYSCTFNFDKTTKKLTLSGVGSKVNSSTISYSGGSSQTTSMTVTKAGTYKGKVWFDTGDTAECSYEVKESDLNGGSSSKPTAPTIAVNCGTTAYTSGEWCKSGLAVNVNGVPAGATKKQCLSKSSSNCDPFTGTYSTIMTSGTYKVCAGYITKDNQNSEVACTNVINAKIDTTDPTCSITFTAGGTTLYGVTGSCVTIKADLDDKESGVAGFSWDGTTTVCGTRVRSVTVQDNAGRTKVCTVTITQTKGSASCPDGYDDNGTNCIQYHHDPGGVWSNYSQSTKYSKTSCMSEVKGTLEKDREVVRCDDDIDRNDCERGGVYGVNSCYAKTTSIAQTYTANGCEAKYIQYNNKCYLKAAYNYKYDYKITKNS